MTFKFVILAAGKGTRMGLDIPKALTPVGGKPILQYLYEAVVSSGVNGAPVVVIGHERNFLCEAFGKECEYAIQEEQLGTAHALNCAREQTADADAVVVLYGDHPFVSDETLRKLAAYHEEKKAKITMMTTKVETFDGWYKAFLHWGRVLRDARGHIIGIREYKDAMESERQIMEVNPALYCFDTKWLWENIDQIKNFNASEEYYLTDLVELAVTQAHEVASLFVPAEETIGINTPEEREIAETLIQKRHASS